MAGPYIYIRYMQQWNKNILTYFCLGICLLKRYWHNHNWYCAAVLVLLYHIYILFSDQFFTAIFNQFNFRTTEKRYWYSILCYEYEF